jgi:hypothetical protein
MAYRWLGVLLLSAAFVVGCGSDGVGDPFGVGGTGGGSGGVGGSGGSGGAGGEGGSIPECVTSLICRACPSEGFCSVDTDCSAGSVCIESGCDTLDGGSPIKQCVFAGGGACNTSAMCLAGRECVEVPEEGRRCVRTVPGCDTIFDCPPGFDCESGSCADRRVPCDLDAHCPKNHICSGAGNSTFCVRVQRDCLFDFDCSSLAPRCEDIDGDGNKECAGTFDLNDPSSEACVNTVCTDGSAPVCEVAAAGSATQCGQYGLCRDDNDCAGGFSCVGLWPDGRSECVPGGGTCGSFSDCPVRQACASPRDGGAPSCQAGFQP